MKRRFGMLIGIICIIIVGVSVTRMTKEFIVSNGVEASSIINAADAGLSVASPGGGLMGQSTGGDNKEKHIVIQEAVTESVNEESGQSAPMEAAAVVTEETVAETAAKKVMALSEDIPSATEAALEETVKTESVDEEESIEVETEKQVMVFGLTSGPGASAEEVEAEMRLNSAAASVNSQATPDSALPGSIDSLADVIVSEESEYGPGNKANVLSDTAIQETVKSPLDPVIDTETAAIETIVEIKYMTPEDFYERFESAEETSEKLWEKTTLENIVAYQAASEQERVLWDYELNLLYDEIRMRMSEKETEALNYGELNWMKERDQYAEKMAEKSPIKSAQNQNPVYIRALAEKTKERCYWLLTEYEYVLNREPEHTAKNKSK